MRAAHRRPSRCIMCWVDLSIFSKVPPDGADKGERQEQCRRRVAPASPRAKAFARLRRAESLSLAWPRESNQEKASLLGTCRATPDKSVSRGRAFRQHIAPYADEKASASLPIPLRACRPRLTASQGGEDRKQRPQQEQQQGEKGKNEEQRAMVIAEAIAKNELCARLLTFPPLCSGGRAEDQPEGWPAWMPASLASVHGWTVDKPRSPDANLLGPKAREARKAGWPFSWLLLFGHAKTSDSPSEGGRNRSSLLVCKATEMHRKKTLDSRFRGNDGWWGSGQRLAHGTFPSPLPRRPGGKKRISPRVAGIDAGQFGVSPWMDCRQTPQPGREPLGLQAREAPKRGGLSLGYFSLARQREATRPPQEDEAGSCLLLNVVEKVEMDDRVRDGYAPPRFCRNERQECQTGLPSQPRKGPQKCHLF